MRYGGLDKHNFVLVSTILAVCVCANIAKAESIPNGTYQSSFGINDCGVLVSTSTSLQYAYGPCGKAPTYTAKKVSRRGNNVLIDQAKFLDFEIDTQGNLRGKWVFGDYSTMKVFRRK